ncbi:DnaD domain protein [Clostridium tyrobutyricum]|jgi:DnaD/phage-associated family protein|uniref:DNA replication protein DnaD n=1 Tax=Clostridium tyrobutyricum DIVETGP TaxID=1408889 RepID=W6N6E6_CLOTY|nr:DnaD domain protein [Clostridium tyrobutyricum]AND86247.1 DNA replication protein DnaD [Clostridium tyrobutyricum]ANP70738.1 DNA replication protein DnaD [Clostridium tyrobutyricum]MBR9648151.1 DnaD domain protein [Clostridium tyrobutyricum]MBV4416938.1 DnaD domain protein [Clostridium tyrobutyricum]MBV4422712.1 DnaD domain protein [Clostridium tyrobutyricum]
MSTFVFKDKDSNYTPVSNIFIERFMPKARGEFVKVYLLGLKYCNSGEVGVSSEVMASALHLLETDVINAWNYWDDENVIKIVPIDKMGNYSIKFLDLSEPLDEHKANINIAEELNKNSTKDMLQDIEKLLGRSLSSKEITIYISWIKDYNFSPEIILLLIQYCVLKRKTDSRYIEKIAISWFDAKIKNINDAQVFIKKHEDKWINIRKILNYLGIKDGEVMKPQEDLLSKWLNVYNFSVDIIFKACDICFKRINKADFKYIDGILASWHKDKIKTLDDIQKKDKRKIKYINNKTKNISNSNSTFNNFKQRDYDFKDLEKKLLGWDNND